MVIHWIVIYEVDVAIQLLKYWGLYGLTSILFSLQWKAT